ncbi:hypothetical protein GCM10008967_09820 [Bacillus carboniphilus]|uniref:6-phosphogluconate dehydrogenase NADP-binding domain-containing protein n=1 Tax=Bacillus carboniphilus TaxID=86663 RepID=A0ABN0VZN8_9BACI
MKQPKEGLVGIGKLGTAMMTHWNQNDIRIENECDSKQFSPEYLTRALTSIAPEVI